MTSIGSGTQDRYDEPFDIDALLRRGIEMIDSAKSMPLSASVIVPRDEMVGLFRACIENLPLEVRQANWMLKEREEFLAKMQREGDEILQAARERAERLVQRSDLVKAAQKEAQRTVDDASDEARRLRHEAEDYCDQKLAAFENVLERTLHTVQGGREKLRGAPVITLDQAPSGDRDKDGFFDQEKVR